MKKDIIMMSRKEAERLKIIHKVMDKEMTQVEGGEFLGLCERQIRRIVRGGGKKGGHNTYLPDFV